MAKAKVAHVNSKSCHLKKVVQKSWSDIKIKEIADVKQARSQARLDKKACCDLYFKDKKENCDVISKVERKANLLSKLQRAKQKFILSKDNLRQHKKFQVLLLHNKNCL